MDNLLPVTIDWSELQEDVLQLCDQLEKRLQTLSIKRLFGVPRNGMLLAVMVSHKLDIPLSLTLRPNDMDVLIIDDIVDSGATLDYYKTHFGHCRFASVYHRRACSAKPWVYAVEVEHEHHLQFPWETERSTKGNSIAAVEVVGEHEAPVVPRAWSPDQVQEGVKKSNAFAMEYRLDTLEKQSQHQATQLDRKADEYRKLEQNQRLLDHRLDRLEREALKHGWDLRVSSSAH